MSRHGNSSKKGTHGDFNMAAAVRRVVTTAGFEPDLDDAAKRQLDSLTAPAPAPGGVKDLRSLPWSSIDNTESRDLDQVEVAESLPSGDIRLIVGIADVDALVGKGTPLDQHAYANCTSVYTGVAVFPMLPEKLSTDLTSLNENEDRLSLAIETVVNGDGD